MHSAICLAQNKKINVCGEFSKIRKFIRPRPVPAMFLAFWQIFTTVFLFLTENKRIMRLFSGLSTQSSHKKDQKVTRKRPKRKSKSILLRENYQKNLGILSQFFILNMLLLFIFRIIIFICGFFLDPDSKKIQINQVHHFFLGGVFQSQFSCISIAIEMHRLSVSIAIEFGYVP